MAASQILLPICAIALIGSVMGMEQISDRTEPPGPIHISYWEKWTGFELDAMKAVVKDFNESQNKIQVDLLAISDVGNKTMFSVSAGVPPDVAGLWGENVPQYVDDRAVMPLDDFCNQAGLTESYFIPAYWQLLTYKGHIWALPTTPFTSQLIWNTELFKKAGLDPNKPPETLEELSALSDKLTVEPNGHLERAGFMPSEPGDWNWGWGYLFGGKLWNGKDKITADTPENDEGYDWVESFSKKYGPSETQTFKSGFGNFASPQNSFVEGLVAMELQGVWAHNFIHRYDPNLEIGTADFPHPANRPDLAGVTFVGADIMVIPRGAKHPKEAFEFMKFVESQKEMEKLCLLQEKNSPLTNVSENFFNENKNPDVRKFDRAARGKNVVVPPRTGIWAELTSEMNAAFDEVNLAQMSGKQAMQGVQTRMQARLDQYRARLAQREREGL